MVEIMLVDGMAMPAARVTENKIFIQIDLENQGNYIYLQKQI